MGGMGSGRHWYWGAKDSTDDYLSIDVRRWKRDGLLTPHQFFGWQWSRHGEVVASICVRTELDRLILTYRHRWGGEDWQDESYPVYLDWTACNLGGQRPWFLCPARGCGRRVAILYGGRHLRLSALLPAGLPQPAGRGVRSRGAAGGPNPEQVGMEARHPQRQRVETQGDAPEHLRAANCAA